MWCHCLLVLGCEDIVADRISLDSVVAILKWSSQPYGSKWVHRQAMHFLCEEFSQVMTSDVLYELSKEHLLAAIQSDYLQVMTYTNSPWVLFGFPSVRLSSSGFSKFRVAGYESNKLHCKLGVCDMTIFDRLTIKMSPRSDFEEIL